MAIDFYCYPSKTGELSVFLETEQYQDSKEKEYYEYMQREVLAAKEKKKLLLYHLETDKFLDENGKQVNIFGKIILPRSTIPYVEELLKAIKRHKGISLVNEMDEESVAYWFDRIPTIRNIQLTTRGELEADLEVIEEVYSDVFFLKTVRKGFAGICSILSADFGFWDSKTKFLMVRDGRYGIGINMVIPNEDTPLMICQAVKVLQDDFGKREWRAFVIEHELVSLSRHEDEPVVVEEVIFKKAKQKIAEWKEIMPSCYVVDFFEYTDKDGTIWFDVCECNSIVASGIYYNNNIIV